MKSSLSKWEIFLRISKIIETLAVLIAVFAIIRIPYEIRQLKNSYNKNTFDVLNQLSAHLREGENQQVFLSIDQNKPIFNNGITDNDLDLYLYDLSAVYDAYAKKLVSLEEVYRWFDDYINETMNNPEVQEHIRKIRLDDASYYQELDWLNEELKEYR